MSDQGAGLVHGDLALHVRVVMEERIRTGQPEQPDAGGQVTVAEWEFDVPIARGRWEGVLPFTASGRRLRVVVDGLDPVPESLGPLSSRGISDASARGRTHLPRPGLSTPEGGAHG